MFTTECNGFRLNTKLSFVFFAVGSAVFLFWMSVGRLVSRFVLGR